MAGMRRIEFVLASSKAGLMFEYDYANQKLKAMYPTGGSSSPAASTATTPVATGAMR
jgi:hypothetical protein